VRIAHVVTLISDSGAYGGPVSVACAQAKALQDRGHRLQIAALWRGASAPPSHVNGVELHADRARTFIPRTGFLGLFSPTYPRTLWRVIGQSDVVHVHTGRDLASLGALIIAAIRRRKVVVQTHGMVQVRTSATARAFDLLLRPTMRRAVACLVLTEQERSDLTTILGHRSPPLVYLPNGVPDSKHLTTPGRPDPVVLFLARLHPRKRPEAFVAAAALVREGLPNARFVIVGPDEGSLEQVQQDISVNHLEGYVNYQGAMDHTHAVRAIAEADVYVLPSFDEPFGMTILEALSVGTPVVCTTSTGISDLLGERGAAAINDGSPAELAKAITQILTDATYRDSLVAAGHTAIEDVFAIGTVASMLEEIYAGSRQGVKAS
jgi:glycosyltransferase involved in cell wall biosynthesis